MNSGQTSALILGCCTSIISPQPWESTSWVDIYSKKMGLIFQHSRVIHWTPYTPPNKHIYDETGMLTMKLLLNWYTYQVPLLIQLPFNHIQPVYCYIHIYIYIPTTIPLLCNSHSTSILLIYEDHSSTTGSFTPVLCPNGVTAQQGVLGATFVSQALRQGAVWQGAAERCER